MEAKLSSVLGNFQRLDGGAMFGNAPKPMWERWIKADELNRIDLACRSFLLEVDGLKILLETGVGDFFDPKLKERFGVIEEGSKLIENLSSLGVSEDDIDVIILSHLHFDHMGGLIPPWPAVNDKNLKLRFKNAEYVTSKEHLDRALNPHPRDRASFITNAINALVESERLTLISRENPKIPEASKLHKIKDFLEFSFADGHTPDQIFTLFKGIEKKVIFTGDFIPGTQWIHASLSMGYDRFPEKGIDEKLDFLPNAEKEGLILLYTHDPYFCASKVRKNEKGKYSGVDEYKELKREPL